MKLSSVAGVLAASLISSVLMSAHAKTQTVGEGKAPVPPPSPNPYVKILRPPGYALPATGHRIGVRNVTTAEVECDVGAPQGDGGRYAIGPGAQFEFFVEQPSELIELRCPKVRNGAPLTQVKPATRYIFRRTGLLGRFGIGPIEFNEII